MGGTLVDVVEALVLTKGLGRHVTLLCRGGEPHGGSSTFGSPAVLLLLLLTDEPTPATVQSFFQGLGDKWTAIPDYLGFSVDEVAAITTQSEYQEGDHVIDHVTRFLRVWRMPDCGQKTLMILQKLKAAAGIQDSRVTNGKTGWQYCLDTVQVH